jgi:hypothetical protein
LEGRTEVQVAGPCVHDTSSADVTVSTTPLEGADGQVPFAPRTFHFVTPDASCDLDVRVRVRTLGSVDAAFDHGHFSPTTFEGLQQRSFRLHLDP